MTGIMMAVLGGAGGPSIPVNTVAPVVTGTAQVGQTLSCTTGTWTGKAPITYTYQWQYGAGNTNISGATSSTYVIQSAYVGQTIRCLVTATNSVGAVSAPSNSTSAVSATVPTAPTVGTVNYDTATSLTVDYTASSSDGGSTITSYTAVSSPGNITGSISTSGSGTITVSGLTKGQAYTFVVYATNSIGNSPNSASSASKIASTTPSAPTIGTATATGQTTASVTFTPPADNGGQAITQYVAISYPGGIAAYGSSSPISFTGLTAGMLYQFRVYAVNPVGNGDFSGYSNFITTFIGGYLGYTTGYNYDYHIGGIDSSSNLVMFAGKYNSGTGMFNPYYVRVGSSGTPSTQTRSSSFDLTQYGNPGKGTVISDGRLITNSSTRVHQIGSGGSSLVLKTAINSGTSAGYDSSANIYGVSSSYLAKFNNSGTVTWSKRYTVSTQSVVAVGFGVSLSGTSSVAGVMGGGLYVHSTNSSGTLLWGRQMTGGTVPSSAIAHVDASGNTYFIFNSTYLIKMNSSGTIDWQKYVSGGAIYSVTTDSSGNAYAGAYGGGGTLFIMFNSSGTVQWQKVLTASNSNYLMVGQNIATDGTYIYATSGITNGLGYIRLPANGGSPTTFSAGGINYTYANGSASILTSSYTVVAATVVQQNDSPGNMTTTDTPSMSSASESYSTTSF